MVERVPTGIQGLDEILNGGLIKNRHVLLTGGPGTGKTIMCYEYLYKGAEVFNQKGLFVSLELSPERVVESAKILFNWDWDKHLNKNIIVTRIQRNDLDNITSIVGAYVNEHGIERVVVDSLTLLRLYFRNDDAYRSNLIELYEFLSSLSCTTIVTSEKSYARREDVINLYLLPRKNDRIRVLEVLKMRDTNHSLSMFPFVIDRDGVLISSKTGIISKIE
jgi:KaiC/GvpD/RAD55 family RecA-like ATPase